MPISVKQCSSLLLVDPRFTNGREYQMSLRLTQAMAGLGVDGQDVPSVTGGSG